MNKNILEREVKVNFRFLQDKYSFSEPVANDYGREIFINYDRANQTVSISYEFGGSPRIEILYPSAETGDRLVPWATKDGVQRSRRFPKIRLVSRFSDDENSIAVYVKEMAVEFEKIESNWLKQNASLDL